MVGEGRSRFRGTDSEGIAFFLFFVRFPRFFFAHVRSTTRPSCRLDKRVLCMLTQRGVCNNHEYCTYLFTMCQSYWRCRKVNFAGRAYSAAQAFVRTALCT